MKRKRYTAEKIIAMLQEHEAGASVPELSRRHGIAENTIYRWKSKFGGMEISEATRLRELEGENAKLKRLLAEAERDQGSAERARPGKMVTAAQRRRAVEHLKSRRFRERCACQFVGFSRSAARYRLKAHHDTKLRVRLKALAEQYPPLRLPDAARDAEDRRPRD